MTAPAQLRTCPAADGHAPNRQATPIRQTVVLCPAPPVMAPPPMPVPTVRTASVRTDGEADCRPAQRDRLLRVTGAVAVTLAMVGVLGWLGQAASAGSPVETPAETSVVRVGAGETVWDVAVRVAPESDPRAVVQRIRELNGMASSAVQPGQRLQVPDGR